MQNLTHKFRLRSLFSSLTAAWIGAFILALPFASSLQAQENSNGDELISIKPSDKPPVGTPVLSGQDLESAVGTAREAVETIESSGAQLPSGAEIRSAIDEGAALIPEEVPDSLRDAAIEASRNFEALDEATARAQQAFEQFSSATMQQRELVTLREARNRIIQSPELKNARLAIDNARTDQDRRLARIAYYEMLYSKLEKAVPGAKDTIATQREGDLSRQEFKRVRSHAEVAAEESAGLDER